MRMDKKGFTLIEILAAVVILGILTTVGASAVLRYIGDARDQSYDTMKKSAYSAAQDYLIHYGAYFEVGDSEEISIETLVEEGFLEPLVDPTKKDGSNCTGKVVITRKASGSSDELDNLEYQVCIRCAKYNDGCEIYP